MSNKAALTSLLSTSFFLATKGLVFAQQINVKFADERLKPQDFTVPSFIQNFYLFALGAAGVLTVGMIIVGGIYYSVSGAVDQKSKGKEIIMGALWGLLLLLSAYVILRTVNPKLVELSLDEVEKVGFEQCADHVPPLRFCGENEPERNFDTGECQCQNKPADACPISMKPKRIDDRNAAPTYQWLKEIIPDRRELYEAPNIPDMSTEPGKCPDIVKIPAGTTPYFITSACKKMPCGLAPSELFEEGGTFFMDLSRQPDEFSEPLPPGEHFGYTTPFHIIGKMDKVLCLITEVHSFPENGSSTVYYLSLPHKEDDLIACGRFSEETEDTTKLRVKKSGIFSGEECRIGTGACAPGKLSADCPAFDENGDLEDASKICVMESGGAEQPTAVSGSDFCKNEAGKLENERHAFSMGLFQINVIANGRLVTQKSGDSSCEGLFSEPNPPICSKTVPCKLSGGTATGYDCSFIAGKEAQWTRCREILSNPNFNIQLACQLYKDAGNKLSKPWRSSYDKCDL